MAGRDMSPTSSASIRSTLSVRTEKEPASRASSAASPPMSTPPTSLGDEASVLSDAIKMDQHVETHEETVVVAAPLTPALGTPQSDLEASPAESSGRRSMRASRKSVTTYNVQMLAGTAIHTPTKYLEKHHKNVLHGDIKDVIQANNPTSPKKRPYRAVRKSSAEDISDPAAAQLASEAAQADQRRKSSRVDLRKEALRNLTAAGEAITQKGAELLSSGRIRVQHALLGSSSASSAQTALKTLGKRAREQDDGTPEKDEEKEFVRPKTKKWEKQGLYIGQHRDFDARLKESKNRMRKTSKRSKENASLPLPMFAGQRMLEGDFRRDFKLPFDTYNPLPRKVKVDGWVKLQKNRFIGEASALWKRDKQDSSQCYCSPEDGCGEACHNRIMAYECDETNCPLTAELCNNRPFAQLKKRAKGNRYDYGVEVAETEGKGYGVRAMRTFEPHQIIVEYAGEIITQAECERRMKQIYKKDKCYYLMSFDNKMIIDATRGTIARFVNHSCEPNCEMIKWTVGGEPRMALFAGSRGIMSGEELTYDYNFDPFSSKNIQECRCGTRSCRGVLGPKPKHQQQPREEASIASTLLAGTKRKLQQVFGSGSNSAPNSPKKRRLSSMVTAAMTKAQNAKAESAAALEKAEKKELEHAAQIASRESRAMRRHSSVTLSSRRSKMLRKSARQSLPALKTTRHTTVNFKRRTPKPVQKPGALKPVSKTAKHPAGTSLSLNDLLAHKKVMISAKTFTRTPTRKPTPESETNSDSESDSPNITPASLRSASRRAAQKSAFPQTSSQKKLTQSKLNFKPLKLGDASSKSTDNFEVPDSEDDDAQEFGAATTGSKKSNTIRGSVRRTLDRSVRGPRRAIGVAKAGASLGFKGIGGLKEGGSKNTIRLISGVDD